MPTKRRFKTLPRRIKRIAKSEIRNFWAKSPIRDHHILYESYSGNGMLCHPEAIFNELLKRDNHSKYTHIWVLNDFDRYKAIVEKYSSYPNVKFVKYQSLKYYQHLSQAKYLVNNVSFPAQFVKRPGQVYLNTWHGIPLKKMGYDISGRAVDAKNIVRNFLASDFLLSSSARMTKEMYLGAFKMNNIFEGEILEVGSPRIDRQLVGDAARSEIKPFLAEGGIVLDDRQVILYAPTWKGHDYFNPLNDAAGLTSLIDRLESQIDTTKFRILIKAHQVVAEAVATIPELREYLVPNTVPTNLVLGITDMLITDYSSIFFDFLVTKRPVFFHIPDMVEYARYRDLYVGAEELPGPTSTNVDELIDNILNLSSIEQWPNEIRKRHEKMRLDYTPDEDGHASGRVIDRVFSSSAIRSKKTPFYSDGRKKILIYAGGMIPNGITTSALNLLDNIDYTRYDVTVLCPFSKSPDKQYNFTQVNDNARLMFRFGTFNGTYLQNSIRLRVLKRGAHSAGASLGTQKKLWETEWRRCFGDSRFDHVIDFSGYTSFWGTLFSHAPTNKRSIWLHNDLAADAHRSISGNTPLKDGLFATFSIYDRFDNLISVSEGLNAINASSLGSWAPESRFSWASNTINDTKIRELASDSRFAPLFVVNGKPALDQSTRSGIISELVAEALSPNKYGHNGKGQRHAEDGYFTFISVGRLSPEKNHARLIRAFASVHRKNPLTRLVIAGDGPLRTDLEALIQESGLTASVRLLGHVKNPYTLMRYSDAFVLSSDYEGQPMVLLEALVLELPVITTSFGSVAGALPKGVGIVVEPTVEALAGAMLREANSPSLRRYFDVEKYNADAMQEFEKVVADF
ncbi:CDP-glycerol glycerophosphotransferase family protein [Glutamicibacter mishrai]|uniref:glycosyltransferase n=1 Tax=Glutamicibacter mishrai TaxID=1775880 RepID=UPI0020CD561A|nr:glycosyltransferase [Glutamicibacter mishrai]UTT41078.1 CDP-glycerol glycerophosphotransferase family protein [Glutamicibacter mishrai]